MLLQDGKVVAVGSALQAPAGATRVDGTGKWVTPGIIDVHSHLGVYPSPGVSAHSDGNEMTGAGHAERLGRAFDLAAGPGLRRGAGRRHHLAAGAARFGQPDRRPRRDVEERRGHHLPGDEVPRRAVGPEDGLRREPQARLRPEGRPGHAHGQRRRLPRRLHRRQRVPAQERRRQEGRTKRRRRSAGGSGNGKAPTARRTPAASAT